MRALHGKRMKPINTGKTGAKPPRPCGAPLHVGEFGILRPSFPSVEGWQAQPDGVVPPQFNEKRFHAFAVYGYFESALYLSRTT